MKQPKQRYQDLNEHLEQNELFKRENWQQNSNFIVSTNEACRNSVFRENIVILEREKRKKKIAAIF